MIQPLGNRVLIERTKPEERTVGGIIIPSGSQAKPNEGKVLRLGLGIIDGVEGNYKFSVKKGDTVIFNEYGISTIKQDDKEYILVEERDIYCIVPT